MEKKAQADSSSGMPNDGAKDIRHWQESFDAMACHENVESFDGPW